MKIKMLVMDVDGTLTDGRIYIGPEGEVMKAFDVKDGYGITKFICSGGIPVIITGRNSKIVESRCRELGIGELYQGVQDKLKCLIAVQQKYGLTQEEIAYIGDDENDLMCLKYVGLPACPSDAICNVVNKCFFQCKASGGRGAVREFIDYIIKDS